MTVLSKFRELRHNKLAKVVIGGAALSVGAVGTAFSTTAGQQAAEENKAEAQGENEIDLEGQRVFAPKGLDVLSDDLDDATLTADSADSPESADSPATPDSPESVDSPATPDSPETPDSPATPDSPETPDSPATPDSPETPDSPATPDSPDDGDDGDN
jgi:hypothetical protein